MKKKADKSGDVGLTVFYSGIKYRWNIMAEIILEKDFSTESDYEKFLDDFEYSLLHFFKSSKARNAINHSITNKRRMKYPLKVAVKLK